MTIKQSLVLSAYNTAKRLDKVKPGWFRIIDINRLNHYSGADCILGQIYGDSIDGPTNLKNMSTGYVSYPHYYSNNFNDMFRAVWTKIIQDRLSRG